MKPQNTLTVDSNSLRVISTIREHNQPVYQNVMYKCEKFHLPVNEPETDGKVTIYRKATAALERYHDLEEARWLEEKAKKDALLKEMGYGETVLPGAAEEVKEVMAEVIINA